MDCNMPIMCGFDAAKKIKSLYMEGKLSYLPYICALTAYTTDEFKTKSFAIGMN